MKSNSGKKTGELKKEVANRILPNPNVTLDNQKKYCLDRIKEHKNTACRGCKYLNGGACEIHKCFK